MYEPCVVSVRRGVTSLFNQPAVPAAAAGAVEGGSRLRPWLRAVPVVSKASGVQIPSSVLRSQVPPGSHSAHPDAQGGFPA